MKIDKTNFGPWQQAWRLEQGGVEMIVVTEIGPRIMSLRLGDGPNILLDDSAGTMARGDWHTWGGHRFWVSPETEATYLPDNDPCDAVADERSLTVTMPVDPAGLQKTLHISACPEHGGFAVRHTLRNTGQMLATGAIWGLTCVVPQGRLVIPWSEGNGQWSTQMVRYWQRWAGHGSDITSRQWQPRNDCFVVEPTGEEGKIGLRTDAGVIALLREDSTFIKHVRPCCSNAPYPDGGCNLELYTCGAFVEMETLSPLRTILPGDSLTHVEHWLMTDKLYQPEQWGELAGLFK